MPHWDTGYEDASHEWVVKDLSCFLRRLLLAPANNAKCVQKVSSSCGILLTTILKGVRTVEKACGKLYAENRTRDPFCRTRIHY